MNQSSSDPSGLLRADRGRPCPGRTGHQLRSVSVALLLALGLAGLPGGSGAVPGNRPVPAAPGSRSSFTAEWAWPLPPGARVVRPFEKPPQDWKPGHRGVDLSTEEQAVVTSPADGTVSFAGTVVDRGVLSIDHGGGRVSSFEPVDTTLLEGQTVRRGEAVATVSLTRGRPGSDGAPGRHCGGACLHWGVRVDGDYVDPLSFVMDRRPSVLLPLDG